MLSILRTSMTSIGLAALAVCSPAAADETGALTETLLLNRPLQGWEGKESNVVLIEAPAGFETPPHMHPGHIFIYVLEGTVELALEGLPTQTLVAGEVAYELPGHPMVGRNASASEGARILVFQIGDIGAPLELPVTEN